MASNAKNSEAFMKHVMEAAAGMSSELGQRMQSDPEGWRNQVLGMMEHMKGTGAVAYPGGPTLSQGFEDMISAQAISDEMVQKALKDGFMQALTGALRNPDRWSYGDGEQTPVRRKEAMVVQHVWGRGGDYSLDNPALSDWARDCHLGEFAKVKAHLDNEPKLLDRRETLLRLNGLFHVIYGMRTVDSKDSRMASMKVEKKEGRDHLACAKFLIERGTPVDCRDMAGHTPFHHCTGMFGTKLTLKLADYLLDKGADINARNRNGDTPLMVALSGNNELCVDFLLERDPETNVTNYDGNSLVQSALNFPDLQRKMWAYASKKSELERSKAKATGKYRTCAVCSKSNGLKRCTGCFLVWYCGSKCQKDDWKGHKANCKATQAEYVPVVLRQHGHSQIYNWTANSEVTVTPKSEQKISGKHHFIVKVGIAHVNADEGGLTLYNKEKTVYGQLAPKDDVYLELVRAVKKDGVMGVKGFFYAIWEDGKGLRVNAKRIQPPESW